LSDMPTLTIRFDNLEKIHLYKKFLKTIINENPQIKNQSQALELLLNLYLIDLRKRSKASLDLKNKKEKMKDRLINDFKEILDIIL